MGALSDRHGTRWVREARRLARKMGVTILAAIGLFAIAGFVLWDADFYVARDKWEHLKLALFGEWQPKTETSVQDIFDTVDTINLFRKSAVADVGTFVTGASYTSREGVESNLAAKKWCYLNRGGGAVVERVTLGEQNGTDTPKYTDTEAISADVLSGLGVSAARLSGLARLHCRFADFRAR